MDFVELPRCGGLLLSSRTLPLGSLDCVLVDLAGDEDDDADLLWWVPLLDGNLCSALDPLRAFPIAQRLSPEFRLGM